VKTRQNEIGERNIFIYVIKKRRRRKEKEKKKGKETHQKTRKKRIWACFSYVSVIQPEGWMHNPERVLISSHPPG